MEGGVINLQTICAKASQRTVSKQRRFLFIRRELGKKGWSDKGWYFLDSAIIKK